MPSTIGEHWTESATPKGSDRLDLYPTVPPEQKFGVVLVQSNICDALIVQINWDSTRRLHPEWRQH